MIQRTGKTVEVHWKQTIARHPPHQLYFSEHGTTSAELKARDHSQQLRNTRRRRPQIKSMNRKH